MKKRLRGNPTQTLKLMLYLFYWLAALQIISTPSATKKKINSWFIRKIYSFSSQIHKTNDSTCTISLLGTVLLPISTQKLHLKTLISRISHPQWVRVTCSLFFELEMIFAIKKGVTSLHSLSNILKLDVHDLLPWISAPWKKNQLESSDWEQDSPHLNFSCQDWASCLS